MKATPQKSSNPISKRSFTLVEVMVGMIIMAMVTMGMLASASQTRAITQRAEKAHVASTVVNNHLELFRTRTFDEVFALVGNSTENILLGLGQPASESETINRTVFNKDITVSQFDINGDSSNAVMVTVTVSWQTPSTPPGTTSSVTLFTRNGLSDQRKRIETPMTEDSAGTPEA